MSDLDRVIFVRADAPLVAALKAATDRERAKGHRRSRAEVVRSLLIDALARAGHPVAGIAPETKAAT